MTNMMKVNGSAPAARQDKEAAAALWKAERSAGRTLTGRALAERFGKGERWGQGVISEVKKRDAEMTSRDGVSAPRIVHGGVVEPHGNRITDPAVMVVESDGYDGVEDGPHAVPNAVFTEPHGTERQATRRPHEDLDRLRFEDPIKARQIEHERARRTTAWNNNHPHARTVLNAFYGLVLVLALVGQTTGAADWVPISGGETEPTWFAVIRYAVAFVFALVLELGAVALLAEAAIRAASGDRSIWLPMSGAFGFVTVAGSITFLGHWGNETGQQLSAVAFLLVTVVGFVMVLIKTDWKERPEHARRKAVEKAVNEYVSKLDMPEAEKAVLKASVGADEIARRITAGLDNDAIADRLADAIDPADWKTAE